MSAHLAHNEVAADTLPQLIRSVYETMASLGIEHDVRPARPDPAVPCDGTLAKVQSGACRPTSTFIAVPFREAGDFVFHCHILEHEDGGMMARIRVVVSPVS